MAVVTADHGVCGDAGGEVSVIFPCEVEGGGHGLSDVAGGAEALADDVGVWLGGPFFRLGARDPVSSLADDCVPEWHALSDAEEEAGEGVCGAENIRVGVGEADVFLDRGAELGEVFVREDVAEGGDLGEAADVFILDGAFPGGFPLGVAGEESAVVFLEVGVAVATGGEHVGDVVGEPLIGIVAAVFLG